MALFMWGLASAWAAPVAANGVVQVQAATPEVAQPWLVLTGMITRADYKKYREVSFDLPPGVTRLTISYSYGSKAEHTAIDLGLADPERWRGWSGGARTGMTLSAEDATPGYVPGPLPEGRWRIIFGIPNIRAGVVAPYEARIFIDRSSRIGDFAAAELNPHPGWYRGDLHMHSGHSDGKCPAQSGAMVPCPAYRTVAAAAARGLDFIALTDHNSVSHFDALRELQPAFDRLLLVPGREITTFYGHANVFGPTDFLDFRMTTPSDTAAGKWLQTANDEGGIVSINHPGVPSGETCMGCGWEVAALPNHAVAAIEVINGGTQAATKRAESPAQGFTQWNKLLNQGQHITGIGGSDNHNPDIPADQPGAIGMPTTAVYMRELSVRGLLDGIRAGRVFVDLTGSHDKLLDVTAVSGGQQAVMGETLAVKHRLRLHIQIVGIPAGSVEFVVDGQPLAERIKIPTGTSTHFSALMNKQQAKHWLRVNVRNEAGELVLVGNPIYLEASGLNRIMMTLE